FRNYGYSAVVSRVDCEYGVHVLNPFRPIVADGTLETISRCAPEQIDRTPVLFLHSGSGRTPAGAGRANAKSTGRKVSASGTSRLGSHTTGLHHSQLTDTRTGMPPEREALRMLAPH